MDVCSLFMVIPHIDGIMAKRQVLCNSPIYRGPPFEFVLELLSLILHNNHFRFEEQWYLQVAGTYMGSSVAPMYANAYMYVYEIQHILSPYEDHITGYYHYDLLIIWKGTQVEAQQMMETLNHLPSPIRFTANISTDKVQYLDLELSCGPNGIEHTLFSKPTDHTTLLHAHSAHPTALKKSIPKAQFQRVIRNNSNQAKAELQLETMTQKFVNRGYESLVLKVALIKAKTAPIQGKAEPIQWMVFPMTFHNSSQQVSTVIKDNWKMVATDCSLPKIFKELPMIWYRRNRNLRDILVHIDLVDSYSKTTTSNI
ncbi:Hypothetical predicted protein [Pelobates cultripes]|uniref:Helix-turn-helix domain-containing protein n=1 Tax=Pelobates cultripes TaxID=61616 RepID=A0AAD1RB43_PELCU|nr:Hypothetical predicted protein [Pelobates cultripes]